MNWLAKNYWWLALALAIVVGLWSSQQRRSPIAPLEDDYPMIGPVAPGETANFYMHYSVERPECIVDTSTFLVKLKAQGREFSINQNGGIDPARAKGDTQQDMPFEVPRYAPPGIGEVWLEFEYDCPDSLIPGMTWRVRNAKRRRAIEIVAGGDNG